jgi:DNA-binding response OmpR family regulator
MIEKIRLLLVEDNVADAELVVREMKRAGISCDSRTVDNSVAFRDEMSNFRPHVVVSDFSMPKFDGLEALRIAKSSYPHVPFIFVSGTLGEDRAVEALQNGARDYVLKNNLLRLPAAVDRAIKETEERSARHALQLQLRESEKLYRSLFEHNPHSIWVYDRETLWFLAVNDTAVARYGWSRKEFLTMKMTEVFQDIAFGQNVGPMFCQHVMKSSEVIEVAIESADITFEGRPARIVVASKVS